MNNKDQINIPVNDVFNQSSSKNNKNQNSSLMNTQDIAIIKAMLDETK